MAEYLIKMHMERDRRRRKEGNSFKRQEKSLVGFARDGGVSVFVCGLDIRKIGAAPSCEMPSTVQIAGAK